MRDQGRHAILVGIECERIELQRKLAELDKLEAHAQAFLGASTEAPAPPAPERAQRKEKPKGARSRQRGRPGEVALAIVEALKRSESDINDLVTVTGKSKPALHANLNKLFEQGKVQHDDGTPRRWSLTPSLGNGTHSNSNSGGAPNLHPNSAEASAEKSARTDAPVRPSDEVNREYLSRRLVAVLGREPQTIEDAAEEIDAPDADVAAAVTELMDSGEISQMVDGRYCA